MYGASVAPTLCLHETTILSSNKTRKLLSIILIWPIAVASKSTVLNLPSTGFEGSNPVRNVDIFECFFCTVLCCVVLVGGNRAMGQFPVQEVLPNF
jgi:hypothetical protein